MANYIVDDIGNRFKVGDVLKATIIAEGDNLCPKDTIVTIKMIDDSGPTLVGLHSDILIENWSDLGGLVAMGHGYWVAKQLMAKYFIRVNDAYEISNNINYKKHNLKGMKCKIIKHTQGLGDNTRVMVEIEKNVGAGCADGLGKTGHCILIDERNLKKIPKKKSKLK